MGGAGTGKSTLLQAMKSGCDKHRSGYRKNFCVTAYTGVAAMNVGGETIHALFKFAIGKSDNRVVPLSGDAKHSLEMKMKDVRVIFIDEMSMIPPWILAKIDERLKSIHGNELPFGGVIIYLIGDLCQLPPVMAPSFFKQFKKPTTADAAGRELFKNHFLNVYVLTQNQRQSDSKQASFREALLNLTRGKNHDQVLGTLNSRAFPQASEVGFENAVYVSHTRADVSERNKSCLEHLNYPVARLQAQDKGGVDKSDGCGLEGTLLLSVGARVMLRTNLCVKKNLVNGSVGTVKDIVYNKGEASPDHLPVAIIVKFDEYRGRTFDCHLKEEKLVPIIPVSRQFDQAGKSCTRRQFPLNLAYAMTTHKTQGLTLDKVVVNPSAEFSAGLAYVAFSRVRTLEGMFITRSLTIKDLEGIAKKNQEKTEELRRLYNLAGIPFD
jgi:ATP-dependent DNA helicase PIF1